MSLFENKNTIYFDAPGIWTTPASINKIFIQGAAGTSGGGGAAGANYTYGFGTGGNGGAGTATILGPTTIYAGGVSSAGGLISGAIGTSGANQPNGIASPLLHYVETSITQIFTKSTGGNAGVWTPSPSGGGGGPGGKGGNLFNGLTPTNLLASTLYPFSIGQAGAGGGGGGGGVGPPAPGAAGGAGGNGGIIPHQFLILNGNNGANDVSIGGGQGSNGGAGGGPNGGTAGGGAPKGPAANWSPGGGGGGSGVHGFLIIYY